MAFPFPNDLQIVDVPYLFVLSFTAGLQYDLKCNEFPQSPGTQRLDLQSEPKGQRLSGPVAHFIPPLYPGVEKPWL